MKIFKCDCCGFEVHNKDVLHTVTNINYAVSITQALNSETKLKWEERQENIDLCTTCFCAYFQKINQIFKDFNHRRDYERK